MQLPLRGVNGRKLLRFPRALGSRLFATRALVAQARAGRVLAGRALGQTMGRSLGDRTFGEKPGERTQDDGPGVASKLVVPLGLAISCLAHLVFLGPAFILAGGSPFNTPLAEAITVDIVSAEDLPQPADNPAQAEPSPRDSASASAASPPAASGSQTAAVPSPVRQLPPQPLPPPARPAAATPQSMLPPPPFTPSQQALEPEPPPAAPSDPASMFGMPMTMPDGSVGGRTFDSQAVDRANIESDAVTAFRSQLKTCSKLPAGVAPDVRVVLRVYLKPDGTLVTGVPQNPEPIKVEGVSIGGGALFQSAVLALRKCQPYRMLPSDRYAEWKALDITFTPQNF
jgi:hypothetical protein